MRPFKKDLNNFIIKIEEKTVSIKNIQKEGLYQIRAKIQLIIFTKQGKTAKSLYNDSAVSPKKQII